MHIRYAKYEKVFFGKIIGDSKHRVRNNVKHPYQAPIYHYCEFVAKVNKLMECDYPFNQTMQNR